MQTDKSSTQRLKPDQTGYLCEAHEKISLVSSILFRDKPQSSVIFCNNRECVDFVKNHLHKSGFLPSSPGGETRKVIVTSDETFRGGKYDYVINFDIPFAPRVYASRLEAMDGAKRTSKCVSLFCDYYSDFAPPIVTEHNIRCVWPPSDLSCSFPLPAEQVRAWLAIDPRQGKKTHRTKSVRSTQGTKPRPHMRSTSNANYASHKPDKAVAGKSRPKSIWGKILSFLAK